MANQPDSSTSPPYQQYARDPSEVPLYGEGDPGQMGHRLSNKERPMTPQLASPGLESIWDSEGLKEVVPTPEQQQQDPPGMLGYNGEKEEASERTHCGAGKKLFFIILAAVVIVILGIALGVGLGVGLNKTQKSSSSGSSSSATPTGTGPKSIPTVNTEYLIGGAINPAYYSTDGAFNGSGIALASQSFATDLQTGEQGSIVMYFQHHTGDIRWKRLDSSSGEWIGGTISETVATDAKNGTSLSAVAYSDNGTNTWHIFYIDQNNMIKQRTNSNITNIWANGPIDDANLIANDADQVGMQACWYGNDYGDSGYSHTPLPPSSGPDGNQALRNNVGMQLWYASDDTTFQQLGWRDGEGTWQHQGSFSDMNGHAGVGCYSWGPGTVTYVMFVNSVNTGKVFWRDTNTNLTNSTTHPINEWVESSVSIPNVNPSSSLGYTNYFYAQMANSNMLNGYNISWAAENTTIVPDSQFVVDGAPGISGTHFSVTAIPNPGGGNNILVFYQIKGDDVTEYTRDLVAGQWTSTNIEIPNA